MEVGETLASNVLRFYLTGRLAIEGARTVDQADLPGRQGRLALVYLVLERHRPVPVEELADALWGDTLPPSWDRSLRVVVSKLRRVLLAAVGPSAPPGDGPPAGRDETAIDRSPADEVLVTSDSGCYQARLGGAWIDVEAAANAVDRAGGAWRRGAVDVVWSEATVAAAITRRPLLLGEDGRPWILSERARLDGLRRRALELLASVHLARNDMDLARDVATELLTLDPLREASHRLLMRIHAAAGDRGEALRVHQRLRETLTEELGVDPSSETLELHRAILQSGTPGAAGPSSQHDHTGAEPETS
ncbi:BTAD domain-containing putative transcriptional regulator [Egicoccus sp. AB-alg2]|uniref:AfsR/SARP family transcriptional regulator n=1 Tax=Egicoccus sp. AB-alg2 TaxID=3242693 RepID=UPI00359E1E82